MPFRFSFYPTLACLSLGGLLLGCSQSPPATTASSPVAGPAAPAPAAFPYGAKVDSLNGVAGHTFGQPLSAFSHLELLPPTPGVPTRVYRSGPGQPTGWFGKHRREVPSQFYYFLDGRFVQFRAIGDAVTLRTEAQYLFGPALQQGPQQFWEGRQARATLSEQARGFGIEGTLNVISKPFEAALAAQAQAKLQAENAQ